MIKIGICGAGAIVENHCRAIERTGKAVVSAISSRSLERAQKTAGAYGIAKAFDEHRRLIESPDVDAVIIATPNYQHRELALFAVECGKPVMVEKPLAMNAIEGAEMVTAAKARGVPLFYAEQLPLAPKFVKLAAMAKAGGFGRVYMVRQIERHAGPYSPWFFRKETASGGALADLGCHSIAVAREIKGRMPVKRVAGVAKNFTHPDSDVEDFMILQMEFEDGCVGVIESNWCHLGGMDSITEIFGTEGNGYADLMKGSGLTTFTRANPAQARGTQPGWNHPLVDVVTECGYLAQAEAMLAAILRGEPPAQSGEDGLEILRIMDAGYQSAKADGKWIDL